MRRGADLLEETTTPEAERANGVNKCDVEWDEDGPCEEGHAAQH